MIDVKPFVETLRDRPVAVLGLGISNMAAVKALMAAGAKVWAWDDQEIRRADAETEGAVIRDLREADLTGCACLVMSPGIPLHYPEPHPVAAKARETGREIICDLEILHRCGHGRRTVGVTGTNGKSTTTALIGHILRECGRAAEIGGNIGKAALALDMPPADGVFVLEMSSFQLDLCPTFTPDIAVHLNLSADHIDRHGSPENYAAAKARIFSGSGDAVIGVDDRESEQLFQKVKETGQRAAHPVSGSKELKDGVCVSDGILYDRLGGEAQSFPFTIKTLPGVHNQQNGAAAYAAARLAGLPGAAIFEAMKTFPGLPHRQYLTAVINGVAYVNDSKATNADAAARALACYRNIYWIAGGRPKEGGLQATLPYLDRVQHVFLVGEAMEAFGAWLGNHGVARSFSGVLERAVADAHAMAQAQRSQPGGAGTVLLSPACASFDQFKNFEERGEAFAAMARDLEGKANEET